VHLAHKAEANYSNPNHFCNPLFSKW